MKRAPAGLGGLMVALGSTLIGPGPRLGAAQVSEVRLEVGASRVLPPTGVDGGAADFVVAGLRGSRHDLSGSGVFGSFVLGRALNTATGGDFLSGELGGIARLPLGRAWSTEAEGRLFGFRVAEPFSYEAAAFQGSLALRYRAGPISARLTGVGGLGRSQTVLSTVVERMRHVALGRQVLTDDLWRYGADLEVLAGGPTMAAGLEGGVHESAGGTFRSVGARVLGGGAFGVVELRVDAWQTPEGGQTTGALTFSIPWGAWSVRGTAGKPEPDPLLMAEPGREAGGVLVGRRIFGRTVVNDRVSLYEVVGEGGKGARLRFVVDAPPGAREVDVLGDFTLWKPVPMSARGRRWSVELEVPPGTYHFGFLVNGNWYLPADAADAVPDEWGRRSATVVIEPVAGS